jgi:mono/diheme cytochrome c family protein
MRSKTTALLFATVLAACSSAQSTALQSSITLVAPEDVATSEIADPVLRQGQVDYNTYCGHCHGYNGEGQTGDILQTARQQGMRPVPPHNADGNTWRYADQLLVRVVKEGLPNPLDQFPMPPFAEVLTDEQILGVLGYIKLWWTDDQRAYQAQVTANLQTVWDALGVDVLTPTPPAP